MNNPCNTLMTVAPYYLLNWYSQNTSPCNYYNNCADLIFYPDWSTVPYGAFIVLISFFIMYL